MTQSIRRGPFIAGSAAVLAAAAMVPAPARAAQYEYKLGHDLPPESALHVRLVQMFDEVNKETGGRLSVQVFPNSQLGGQTAMLSQLRSGAIQFLATLNAVYGEVVPTAQIASVGFAFKTPADPMRVMDGPLGAYIGTQFNGKGLYMFRKWWDLGMRQMTSSLKPIQTVADFNGFKMRTPPSAIAVDLFKTLGASPTPITAGEIYTSAQTHLIDGLDFPISAIETFKLFEVQKYISITNHVWSGYIVSGNLDAWNALPADIRTIVEKNADKYVALERADTVSQNAGYVTTLTQQGMKFNNADTASMRAVLGGYYARWKDNFGATAWGLLEGGVGKLG